CLTPLRPVFDPEYRRRAIAERGVLGRLMLHASSKLFALVDRAAWRTYGRIFCVSEETRRRAIAGGLASSERAEVLHVGIGIEPDRAETSFDSFFLMPGRIMWTKNLELGIRAFQRF